MKKSKITKIHEYDFTGIIMAGAILMCIIIAGFYGLSQTDKGRCDTQFDALYCKK